ncbi:MAG: uroporphyrinogen decarboxylase family protein [Planctomycetaceae bacterium]|jgi:MtaA/CmuA family methyltransferase|nr:uroporphyrinogen decarboxylase family protein [Planctomycetaceae bacterium]
MTPYDHIIALVKHQTQTLPLMPITMMFAAGHAGIAYRDYVTDYRKLVAAQIFTAEKFHFDYVSVISDPAREAADLGAIVRFFDDHPPAIDEENALLSDKEKLKHLTIADPLRPGSRMFDRVQAAKLFAEKVKGKLLIEGWVEGPCAESSDLRGINRFMMDFIDDPDFVKNCFEFVTENAIQFAAAQVNAGADIIGIGDAAASLISPKLYEAFVLPYEQRLIQKIHEAGGMVRLHICGNTTRITQLMSKTGADLIDLDSMVDIKKARASMGANQVITGNIDPVRVLLNGTPELVKEKLKECREAAETNYVAAAGCEIPIGTPDENVMAMSEFVKGFRTDLQM